jgi:7-cyano-7-deazaguanine synthase
MTKGGLILSGGPDSAVAAWAAIETIPDVSWNGFHFTYGQLAVPEFECACRQAKLLDIPLHHVEIPPGVLTSTMTSRSEHRAADNIEPTFVPGRNALFITFAASRLYDRGNPMVIVGGWNAADSAGYPDCRAGFLEAQAHALRQALDCEVQIKAPVLELMKGDIIRKGVELGVPFEHTWSCYTPRLLTTHAWVPCGECVSCQFRIKGFAEAGVEDPVKILEQET